MGFGGGDGEGDESEPRGETEWDMETREVGLVEAENACDEEEAIEACPKAEKAKLDRASLVT